MSRSNSLEPANADFYGQMRWEMILGYPVGHYKCPKKREAEGDCNSDTRGHAAVLNMEERATSQGVQGMQLYKLKNARTVFPRTSKGSLAVQTP